MDHETGTKKQHALQSILIGGIIILLLVNSISFIRRIERLERRINEIGHAVVGIDPSGDIGALEASIKEALKAEASILTKSSVKLSFEGGKPSIHVSAIPKAVTPDDSIYFGVGQKKMQARTVDGAIYEAVLPLDTFSSIAPYITVERGEISFNEVLPEVDIYQYLSFDVRSMTFSDETKKFSVEILSVTEESASLIGYLKDGTALFEDGEGKKLYELPLTPPKGGMVSVPEYGFKAKTFEADMPEGIKGEDHYTVKVVLKGNGFTLESDVIYAYSEAGPIMEGGTGSFNISFEK